MSESVKHMRVEDVERVEVYGGIVDTNLGPEVMEVVL